VKSLLYQVDIKLFPCYISPVSLYSCQDDMKYCIHFSKWPQYDFRKVREMVPGSTTEHRNPPVLNYHQSKNTGEMVNG
jgi:hypothetical protein